ncbi:hotdog family protein [Psychromonas sp. MME2]|uniref:hotdog family protein n=1 Tax=unclassified Psychromonas TaxID=2614957 RepID=UPI00339BBB22
MAKFADISVLLPHKMPMILIDNVIDVTALTIHCQVTINEFGLFFDKQLNATPAWVGIEFMAQTVAAWSGYHANQQGEPSPIGFLLGSRRYHSECSEFKLGETLDIYAEQLLENEGMAAFACRIECNSRVLASCQLNAFVPPQDKLQLSSKK